MIARIVPIALTQSRAHEALSWQMARERVTPKYRRAGMTVHNFQNLDSYEGGCGNIRFLALNIPAKMNNINNWTLSNDKKQILKLSFMLLQSEKVKVIYFTTKSRE